MEQQSRVRKLGTTKLIPAEYKRTVYSVTPELDQDFDSMLAPEFWTNVAQKFHPGDKIEIFAEDSSYYAELLVTDCGQKWAKVVALDYKELTLHIPDAVPEEFAIRWGGNTAKFKVIRLADKETLKENFATKHEAEAWVRDYQRALQK